MSEANFESLNGATGRYMAAARAEESKRADSLFKDPLASEYAGKLGFEFLEQISKSTGVSISSLSGAVAARTKFFDDALCKQCGICKGPVQIVSLAVGGDSRSIRLVNAFSPNVANWFEIDLPSVIAHRISCIAKCDLSTKALQIGCDLSKTSLSEILLPKGFKTNIPTAWLCEGFFMYLPSQESVEKLVKEIGKLSAPGSSILADFLNHSYMNPEFTKPLMEEWKKFGAIPTFLTDLPERLLILEAGFCNCHVIELGDEKEGNFGRLPVYSEIPKRIITSNSNEIDPIPRNLLCVSQIPPMGNIVIREMKEKELEKGLELALKEHWPSNLQMWESPFKLSLSRGCFGAFMINEKQEEELVGTTFTIIFDEEKTAWILFVIVDVKQRHKGIATQMMVKAIAYLYSKGIKHIGLDASDAGHPVYLRLGFKNVNLLHTFELPNVKDLKLKEAQENRIVAFNESLWKEAILMDEQAFGWKREKFYRISKEGFEFAFGFVEDNKLKGFILSRVTCDGNLRCGPLIAENEEIAKHLIVTLVQKSQKPCKIWILETHSESKELVTSLGFVKTRTNTRMWLNRNQNEQLQRHESPRYFVVGGPDFG